MGKCRLLVRIHFNLFSSVIQLLTCIPVAYKASVAVTIGFPSAFAAAMIGYLVPLEQSLLRLAFSKFDFSDDGELRRSK